MENLMLGRPVCRLGILYCVAFDVESAVASCAPCVFCNVESATFIVHKLIKTSITQTWRQITFLD